MVSQRGGGSKLRLDRRSQPAEKTSRQARVVAENEPAGVGSFRHGLDIASRRRSDNQPSRRSSGRQLDLQFRLPGGEASGDVAGLLWREIAAELT